MKKQTKVVDPAAKCGVVMDCGANAFPVHLYSGLKNYVQPKICVNGT